MSIGLGIAMPIKHSRHHTQLPDDIFVESQGESPGFSIKAQLRVDRETGRGKGRYVFYRTAKENI